MSNTIPCQSRQYLKKIALEIVEGKIITDQQVKRQDLLSFVFFPLTLGAMDDINPDDVGMLFGYYDHAMPMGCGGYPMLSKMCILNKEDAEFVVDTHAKLTKKREAFLESAI